MTFFLPVIAALAVYVIQVLIFKRFWRRSLSARAVFSVPKLREGDTADLIVSVENAKWLPLAAVKMNLALDRGLDFISDANLAVSDRNYRSEIFGLRGYERVTRRLPLAGDHRGLYSLSVIDLVGSDLFYTRRFWAPYPVDARITVLPGRAEPLKLNAATRRLMEETVVPRSDIADPFTLRGIRPYRSGDTVRDINWKASARTGELRVNIHDYTADKEAVILLDLQYDRLLRPDALLEESIRIASSLAGELMARGTAVSLVTKGRHAISGEPVRIGGGADMRHLETLEEGLAALQLPDEPDDSMNELLSNCLAEMKENQASQVTWILISTQKAGERLLKWPELKELAAMALRIVPIYSDESTGPDGTADRDAMLWEVHRG